MKIRNSITGLKYGKNKTKHKQQAKSSKTNSSEAIILLVIE